MTGTIGYEGAAGPRPDAQTRPTTSRENHVALITGLEDNDITTDWQLTDTTAQADDDATDDATDPTDGGADDDASDADDDGADADDDAADA